MYNVQCAMHFPVSLHPCLCLARVEPLAQRWQARIHLAPPPQAATGGRPRSRCSDSCRAPPKLALYPLPALAQRTTHHDRPCKQASAQRVLTIIAAPTRAGRHSVIIAIETPIQNHCRDRSDESLEEQSSREASGLSRSLKFRVLRDSPGTADARALQLARAGRPRAGPSVRLPQRRRCAE